MLRVARRVGATAVAAAGSVASAMSIALRAQRAVYVAFIGSGFGFASWASRIPQIRDELQATPSELGLVLLAMALGALVAMPLAGMVVNRFGTARTVAVLASLPVAGPGRARPRPRGRRGAGVPSGCS